MSVIRTCQTNSAVFNHIIENNHAINWEQSKFIFKNKNVLERNIVESTLINSNFNNNMNLSHGQIKTDPLINHLINKYLVNPS